MQALRRFGGGIAAGLLAAAVAITTAVPAFATPPDPETVVGDAGETMRDSVLSIFGTVVPYAVAVLVAFIGLSVVWRLVKRAARA